MQLTTVQADVVKDRLLRRTSKQRDGCWIWTGVKINQGYGVLKIRPVFGPAYVLVHRAAAMAYLGLATDSRLYVCHHCDVKLCWRPEHLFIGTQKDNIRDMWQKGRGAHYARKLDADKVRHIRQSDETNAQLAAVLSVSYQTIQRVRNGDIWWHI